MCNVMVSYFTINQKVQRNERKSISEQADPIQLKLVDQSMSRAIIIEQIIDGERRSDQAELRGMIRLDQSGVKASGEKRGRSEQSENITEREKRRAKRENKSLVRISDWRVRKVVHNRVEQKVQYRMTQIKENILLKKVEKQQRRSIWKNGR